MKAVLISIQPKWCELIASGKKTMEVRKTRPKLETPFKCYIYCTLTGSNEFFKENLHGDVAAWNRGKWGDKKGKVIGEFACDAIIEDKTFGHNAVFNALACMSEIECAAYSTCSPIYGWHISDLKIYDKPKKISEFRKACGTQNCDICQFWENTGEYAGCLTSEERRLRRPPQSWCYVDEIDEPEKTASFRDGDVNESVWIEF